MFLESSIPLMVWAVSLVRAVYPFQVHLMSRVISYENRHAWLPNNIGCSLSQTLASEQSYFTSSKYVFIILLSGFVQQFNPCDISVLEDACEGMWCSFWNWNWKSWNQISDYYRTICMLMHFFSFRNFAYHRTLQLFLYLLFEHLRGWGWRNHDIQFLWFANPPHHKQIEFPELWHPEWVLCQDCKQMSCEHFQLQNVCIFL